ncbi:MAG TPA: hypothetical protein V6C84_18810 [Coleofasciculaceae cyanobacterium]|jgi:hypothetical protein
MTPIKDTFYILDCSTKGGVVSSSGAKADQPSRELEAAVAQIVQKHRKPGGALSIKQESSEPNDILSRFRSRYGDNVPLIYLSEILTVSRYGKYFEGERTLQEIGEYFEGERALQEIGMLDSEGNPYEGFFARGYFNLQIADRSKDGDSIIHDSCYPLITPEGMQYAHDAFLRKGFRVEIKLDADVSED